MPGSWVGIGSTELPCSGQYTEKPAGSAVMPGPGVHAVPVVQLYVVSQLTEGSRGLDSGQGKGPAGSATAPSAEPPAVSRM
jgi:hypothetical protein